MSTFEIIVLALILDHFLGEPKCYHPLVGFGRFAGWLEKKLNRAHDSGQNRRLLGLLAATLAVSPFLIIAVLMFYQEMPSESPSMGLSIGLPIAETIILYLAIGRQSLKQHARDIYQSLQQNRLDLARKNVAKIVSRDTQKMESSDVSRATVESVLENGSDAVYAAIFWFALAGVPGVLGYRLINTLDAMWGYKTERFRYFGFAVAKCDDILNYIPARLTALSYALVGHWPWAIECWKTQASSWQGVNPGVVMASGAGALGVKLGGADYYHGEYKQRPPLGRGETANPEHIVAGLNLLDRVTILWLLTLFLIF